jgi:hypothetical protein
MLMKKFLNDDAISYIEGELSKGGILSQQIQDLDFKQGTVFTYLPNGYDLPELDDYFESIEFKTGDRVIDKFEDIFSEIVYEYLDKNSRRIAIFETFWEKNDPIVSGRDHQFFLFRSKVYDFISGSNIKKTIKQYLRGAQYFPTIIVLSKTDISNDELFNKDLNQKEIKKIIENIEFLIIGAFDGEGFLFWSKKEIPLHC